MSASVNLPLHHKVQKFASGTSSPGWSQKKGRKTVVVVVVYHCRQNAAVSVKVNMKFGTLQRDGESDAGTMRCST